MVRGADAAAKSQTRAREDFAEADVEGDVAVVRVHVEPRVLRFAVLHHERVVRVERRTFLGPERPRDGPEHLPLELADDVQHADLVEFALPLHRCIQTRSFI